MFTTTLVPGMAGLFAIAAVTLLPIGFLMLFWARGILNAMQARSVCLYGRFLADGRAS